MTIFFLICTVDYLPTTQIAQHTTAQTATTFYLVSTTPAATTTTPDAISTLDTTTEAAVSISLSITASGTNTAGQTYRLVCSATVTGSIDQPTFTRLDPMNNPVLSVMVATTGSMSTLTFSPLTVSHAGTHTCKITTGRVTETQTNTVVVNGTFSSVYN